MNDKKSREKMVRLVNRYFTPLAIILVLSAVIFSQPYGWNLYGSLILLAVAVINSTVTVFFAKTNEWVRILRMTLNLLVNIGLVYMLIPFWYSIWLLLLLTPVAAGFYGSRRQTYVMSLIVIAVLVGIYAARGMFGLFYWGQVFNQALVILFLSLFVNSLACEERDNC